MATKESVISRVQKLLAIAMDDRAPEAERLLAQERADALMVQHMIDQSELAADDPNRSQVVSAQWLFNFESEFASDMETLLRTIVNHTSCSHHVEYKYVSATATESATNRFVYVTGTAENIAYAERLWMIVFNELVRNMFPRWDSSISLDANVYHFVKAGFKWQAIHEIVWDHAPDQINNPYPLEKQYSWNDKANYAGDGGKLKRAYRRELKRLDEPVQSHTSRHGAYRAAYVDAFTDRIHSRLWQMRNDSQKAANYTTSSGTHVSNDRFALVLADAKDAANAKLWEAYPDKHPDAIKARSEALWEAHRAREEERARDERERFEAMTDSQKAAYRAKQARQSARQERANDRWYEEQQRKRSDVHGARRGREVADRVNLNNNQNVSGANRQSVSNRKELD